MLKNTPNSYGAIAKALHWLVAMTVIALFASGLWMVTLNYYDSWYVLAPHYNVSAGIVLAAIMLFRVYWRCYTKPPPPLVTLTPLERFASHWTHIAIYLLIFAILISGYLIPTADNRGIEVFNWFTLPSLGALFDNQSDIAGAFHYWLAWGLVGFVGLHVLAALKHHFVDKDNTLKRML